MIRVTIVSPLMAVRAGLRVMLGPLKNGWGASAFENSRDSLRSDSGSEELQVVAEAASLNELQLFSLLVAPQQSMLRDFASQQRAVRDFATRDVLLVTADALSIPELRRISSRTEAELGLEGRLAVLVLAEDGRLVRELERLPLRAWGILSLDTTVEELGAALRAVAQGLWVADPLLVKIGQTRLLTGQDAEEPPAEPLTDRETQVLQLLARGLANKQIAVELGISEHTVKFHVSSIYARLGVTNRAEAVRRGIQQGWVVL